MRDHILQFSASWSRDQLVRSAWQYEPGVSKVLANFYSQLSLEGNYQERERGIFCWLKYRKAAHLDRENLHSICILLRKYKCFQNSQLEDSNIFWQRRKVYFSIIDSHRTCQ